MLPTTGDAEEGGRQLPVAKRRFRASFGRSRTPERTATCPMLCAQRNRFIASGWQRARKIEKAFCESKVSPQEKQRKSFSLCCRRLEMQKKEAGSSP
ncbi:unnamed protein product [Coccothraustes coccothraustes]